MQDPRGNPLQDHTERPDPTAGSAAAALPSPAVPRTPHRRVLLAVLVAVLAVVALCGAAPGARAAGEDGTGAVERLSATHAVILGVVEGVTEFLPVSSTGHLVVAERLLDLGTGGSANRDALDAYTVIIQFGAILAILVISRRQVVAVVDGVLGRDPAGRRLAINLIAAFVPAAILGAGLGSTIDEHLLSPGPVAGALIVGGVAILVLTGWYRRRATQAGTLDELTVRSALIIGVAQALALWPGTSRSLVTILGGLVVGLSLASAVEFSFLLGLLTLTAATGLKLVTDGGAILDHYGVATPLLGIAAAAVSAFVAVRSFVSYLSRRDLTVFGWYRIAAGVAVVVLIATTARL